MTSVFIEINANLQTLFIGAAFMGVVFLIAYIRNMESRRIRSKFNEDEILMSAYNVQYYGVESDSRGPLRSTGVLILTKEGLYYRAKFLNREITVPGDRISSLSVVTQFKGKNMYVQVVAVNFVNSEGERDRAGFRIPYPERWSQAIHQLFMDKE